MSSSDQHDQCLALLDTHRGILHKVAHTYCSRAEDREDLIQEISLQVWRSYTRFDGRCKFSTWMYRIALNVAISFNRQERDHVWLLMGEDHLKDLPAVPDASPSLEDLQALQRFIDGLDRLNKALVLLYLDGHSHQEIADIVGISPSNVGTKIDRLKQRLRQGPSPGPSV